MPLHRLRQKLSLIAKITCITCMIGQSAGAQQKLGPVTNLPLPRFISLKSDKGKLRRGPSMSHRVDWILQRENMPLKVIGEYGPWRRVQDPEGAQGWMHYIILSNNRTVIVQPETIAIHQYSDLDAPIRAKFEAGVVAQLDECTIDWCHITADGYKGWAQKAGLWGVAPSEIRD